MKKILWAIIIVATMSIISCNSKKTALSPIPADKQEWLITLSPPVAQIKHVADFINLNQVTDIFSIDSLIEIPYSAKAIANENGLTGNSCAWARSAYAQYWPLSQDTSGYLCIIDYQGQLLALVLVDSVTLQCKKLQIPNGTFKRPTNIKLPKFTKAVEWKFIFTGASGDCKKYARGKIIKNSSSATYTEITTKWKGGVDYQLPENCTVAIMADNKWIFCE